MIQEEIGLNEATEMYHTYPSRYDTRYDTGMIQKTYPQP